MKKLTCMMVFLIVCGQALGTTKTIVHETIGRGGTRANAIKAALAEAVARSRGVTFKTDTYRVGVESDVLGIGPIEEGRTVGLDSVSLVATGSVVRDEIDGLVKSYEVVQEKKIDEKTYEVVLRVWVYDYEGPGTSTRLRLAVMPVVALSRSYAFGDCTLSGQEVTRRLSQNLVSAFVQTRKFAVLDREYIDAFAHNRNILLSEDTSLEEKAKLGEVLGADYMLVGTISEAKLNVYEREVRAIGRTVREHELTLAFDYRLIVGPTRQVALADTVKTVLVADSLRMAAQQSSAVSSNELS